MCVPGNPPSGVASVMTCKSGDRFAQQPALPWGPYVSQGHNVLVVNFTATAQSIHGFGSALTESAAYNFVSSMKSPNWSCLIPFTTWICSKSQLRPATTQSKFFD